MFEYVVICDTVYIFHSKEINGNILIKVFDDSNGIWREMNIMTPSMSVVFNQGFTSDEVNYYLGFILNNMPLIKKHARAGGRIA